MFAEEKITVTEKELDDMIVDKLKYQYKVEYLENLLSKFVDMDPERLLQENEQYKETIKELEGKIIRYC